MNCWTAIRKHIVFVVLVLVIICVSACQKTPKNEFVVNEGNSLLDELVLKKADSKKELLETEDRIIWNETKSVNTEIGECAVNVSMDVEMPETPSQVPVYLIEPGNFGMDFLKKAAKYLMDGEKYDGAITKKDIMTAKLNFQKDVSSHTILKGNQSEVKGWLQFFDEEYNKAPESNKEAVFDFKEVEEGYNAFSIKSYSDDNSIMGFSAYAGKQKRSEGFFFGNRGLYTELRYLNEISGENIQANGTKTTYEQALTTANNAMEALFDEPYMMVHADIIDKTNCYEYLWNGRESTSLGQAYVLYYTRKYDNFPSLYIYPASRTTTEETEYVRPYAREYAHVVVDDRGIVDMTYESFSNTLNELNNNVKLIPFYEVLEKFKKDVFYHFIWGRSAEIEITRIEFGMVREPVKDNPDQYMMVSAWNFIGNVKTDWMQEQEKSIMVLSAVNASIVTDYETVVDPK